MDFLVIAKGSRRWFSAPCQRPEEVLEEVRKLRAEGFDEIQILQDDRPLCEERLREAVGGHVLPITTLGPSR
jgi:hypothetical protein